MLLCDYAAYCPFGEGSVPNGGLKEDVSWAPPSNSQDRWVGLGSNASCVEYETLYPAEPLWSLTVDGNEEITRHTMCCPKMTVVTAAATPGETPPI